MCLQAQSEALYMQQQPTALEQPPGVDPQPSDDALAEPVRQLVPLLDVQADPELHAPEISPQQVVAAVGVTGIATIPYLPTEYQQTAACFGIDCRRVCVICYYSIVTCMHNPCASAASTHDVSTA